MESEITTKKIGSKWHGFVGGRPDVDETALTEEAARIKAESVRRQLGDCGAKTLRFGGRICELVADHQPPRGQRLQHESRKGAKVVWMDVPSDDGA
jgi:hypothetical protein